MYVKYDHPLLTLAYIYSSVLMHKYPEIKDVLSYCRFTNHFFFTIEGKKIAIDKIRKAGLYFYSNESWSAAALFRR